MSKRLKQMLEKSAGIRGVNEINPDELSENDKPKTGVGLMAQLAAARVRIRELEEASVANNGVQTLPVNQISPNPWQPRRLFDEAEIQKLAGSIAEIGLIQPIIVRSVSNTDTASQTTSVSNTDTRYQIVAGERRWRAHKLLKKDGIKAVVIDAADVDMRVLALAENFDREDLTDYEFAVAAKNGEEDHGSKKNLAAALGINRTELYQYLSFFQLPEFVINDLEVDPTILGRNAAESIVAVLKKHGQPAIDALLGLWPQVKSRDIHQGKVASLIEASISRGSQAPIQRDIRKLFIGKEQAGSIVRDSGKLKIEIKASALTPEREAELRQFVEKMFTNDESQHLENG